MSSVSLKSFERGRRLLARCSGPHINTLRGQLAWFDEDRVDPTIAIEALADLDEYVAGLEREIDDMKARTLSVPIKTVNRVRDFLTEHPGCYVNQLRPHIDWAGTFRADPDLVVSALAEVIDQVEDASDENKSVIGELQRENEELEREVESLERERVRLIIGLAPLVGLRGRTPHNAEIIEAVAGALKDRAWRHQPDPWEDDTDAAERDAIQHEPPSRWTLLRRPWPPAETETAT